MTSINLQWNMTDLSIRTSRNSKCSDGWFRLSSVRIPIYLYFRRHAEAASRVESCSRPYTSKTFIWMLHRDLIKLRQAYLLKRVRDSNGLSGHTRSTPHARLHLLRCSSEHCRSEKHTHQDINEKLLVTNVRDGPTEVSVVIYILSSSEKKQFQI